MHPQKTICTIDHSKKLKELGVKTDSYFHWYRIIHSDPVEYFLSSDYSPLGNGYNAYNVAELMEFFQNEIDSYEFSVKRDNDGYTGWYVSYLNQRARHIEGLYILVSFSNSNLAHALADTLICLIEKGHVKLEDLKL